MKIALVEDEKTTQIYIKDLLEAQGYEVDIFQDGLKALKNIKKTFYRVVVLDVNLPDMSGFDICHFVKKTPEVYGKPKILILSKRNEQTDINKGLLIGADDYVKKPFDDTEFILRVNRLIEKSTDMDFDRMKYKDLIIDFSQSYVVEKGNKIEITNKEKEILRYFIINVGLTLSKEKIYYEVWGEELISGNKNLEVYIGKLKKKIEIIRENLVTFKNIGYRLKN